VRECDGVSFSFILTVAGSRLMTNDPFHYPPELLNLLIDAGRVPLMVEKRRA
jgi:hypothetical protein